MTLTDYNLRFILDNHVRRKVNGTFSSQVVYSADSFVEGGCLFVATMAAHPSVKFVVGLTQNCFHPFSKFFLASALTNAAHSSANPTKTRVLQWIQTHLAVFLPGSLFRSQSYFLFLLCISLFTTGSLCNRWFLV